MTIMVTICVLDVWDDNPSACFASRLEAMYKKRGTRKSNARTPNR